MKKSVPLLLALAALVLLSGCSSMLKSMGGVSKSEYDKLALEVANLTVKMDETKAAADKAAQDVGAKATLAQFDALQAELGTLKADLGAMKADLAGIKAELAKAQLTAEELEKIKAKVAELSTAFADISDTTLLKLAEIITQTLTQAASESGQAPASTAAPVSTEPAK